MALMLRDPFARAELHRHRVYSDDVCRWCGNVNYTPRNRAYLYRYTVETDGGRTLQTGDGFGLTPGKLYCSSDCRRQYES